VVEDWTLTFTDISRDHKQFKFRATGSVTGDDGTGEAGKRFVSNSGRVVIDPDDVNFRIAMGRSANPGASTCVVHWSVAAHFLDEFAVPAAKNAFGETVVTVAQGIPNGKHTLEITGTPDTPIAAVRVYRPPQPVR
jgi:hypothetical protein